jgi:hypothetical protein
VSILRVTTDGTPTWASWDTFGIFGCEDSSSSLHLKMDESERNVVSDCHADPKGVADSTTEITSCHTSGAKVLYSSGVYRFNGPTLDLSSGVRFQDPHGVIVRNNLSADNVLQFDDAGNLIGLQHNHLEWCHSGGGTECPSNQYKSAAPINIGSLVPPPVSTAPRPDHFSVRAHWYNDARLKVRRATLGSG